MTGIIVTGHGTFPEGILSAVSLVAGKPDNTQAVNFEMVHRITNLYKLLPTVSSNLRTAAWSTSSGLMMNIWKTMRPQENARSQTMTKKTKLEQSGQVPYLPNLSFSEGIDNFTCQMRFDAVK